jgi:hypothetical protein
MGTGASGGAGGSWVERLRYASRVDGYCVDYTIYGIYVGGIVYTERTGASYSSFRYID